MGKYGPKSLGKGLKLDNISDNPPRLAHYTAINSVSPRAHEVAQDSTATQAVE